MTPSRGLTGLCRCECPERPSCDSKRPNQRIDKSAPEGFEPGHIEPGAEVELLLQWNRFKFLVSYGPEAVML